MRGHSDFPGFMKIGLAAGNYFPAVSAPEGVSFR